MVRKFKPSLFRPRQINIEVEDAKNVKKFRCGIEDCRKSYMSKSRLEIHQRTHVSIRIKGN
jgi:hypothetical protein